jgi:hypothetical protein
MSLFVERRHPLRLAASRGALFGRAMYLHALVVVDTLVRSHSRGGDIDEELSEWLVEESDVTVLEPLGVGTSGEVFRGLYMGANIAMKRLCVSRDTAQQRANLAAETKVIAHLRHPNIIELVGIIVNNHITSVLLGACVPPAAAAKSVRTILCWACGVRVCVCVCVQSTWRMGR